MSVWQLKIADYKFPVMLTIKTKYQGSILPDLSFGVGDV